MKGPHSLLQAQDMLDGATSMLKGLKWLPNRSSARHIALRCLRTSRSSDSNAAYGSRCSLRPYILRAHLEYPGSRLLQRASAMANKLLDAVQSALFSTFHAFKGSSKALRRRFFLQNALNDCSLGRIYGLSRSGRWAQRVSGIRPKPQQADPSNAGGSKA